MFGRSRDVVDTAYPGDIVGLVNATALAVGDTLHAADGPGVRYPPMPTFAPEHFITAHVADPARSKQFRRGIAQLEQEGVVQVLVSEARGDASPILAAVGPLQFEVAEFRMAHEFNAPMRTDHLSFSLAMNATDDDAARLAGRTGVELARRADGTLLALLTDKWRLSSLQRAVPELTLTPLLAAGVE